MAVKKDSRLARAGVSGYNKPKRTPSHPTKSHIVVAKEGDKIKEATLFSGVISAIQTILEEIDAGKPTYFTTATDEIFLEAAKEFAVAVVNKKGRSSNEEKVQKMIAEIITNVSFQFEDIPDVGILSEDDLNQLDKIVEQALEKYNSDESEAVKKLKESLW